MPNDPQMDVVHTECIDRVCHASGTAAALSKQKLYQIQGIEQAFCSRLSQHSPDFGSGCQQKPVANQILREEVW